MRKWIVLLFLIFCITGCKNQKEKSLEAEVTETEVSVQTQEVQETQKEQETPEIQEALEILEALEVPETDLQDYGYTEEGETEEYEKRPVLMGGALPFTHMTVLTTENYPDGSYYYEDMTEDGYTVIISCSYQSVRESRESLGDYATRAATGLSMSDPRDICYFEDAEYSENLGHPVCIVWFTTGRNEDTRCWTAFVTEAYDYTYIYALKCETTLPDGCPCT